MPVRSSSTATMDTATTVKTAPISSFRTRYRTRRTPGSTSQSIAGVAAHQVAILSPVSPVMNAPAAAGLKMWRPRQARAYLEADAITQARATPARSRDSGPAGNCVGQKRKYSSRPVISDDSECGRTWNRAAMARLEAYVRPRQSTRWAIISGSPNVSHPSTLSSRL